MARDGAEHEDAEAEVQSAEAEEEEEDTPRHPQLSLVERSHRGRAAGAARTAAAATPPRDGIEDEGEGTAHDEEDEGRDIENDEDRPNDGTEDGNLNSDRLNTGSVGVGGGSEGGIG